MKLKNIIASVLVIGILISAIPVMAEKPPLLDRYIYPSTYLGEPLKREDILNCAYSVINGKVMMYTTLASRPTATFVAYNLTDRKLDYYQPLEIASGYHTKTSWSHRIGSDGCVYLVPHGYISLFKYNPYTREMTDSGSVIDGLNAAYGVCFDDEGNIYFGGFPKPNIYKFNKKLELVKEYPNIFPGEKYIMSMGCYGGKLYAGGQDNGTDFRSIDIATGKVTVMADPLEKYGISDKIAAYYMMDQIDNLLFCTVKVETGMYYLFIFDAAKEEWVFSYRRAYGHYMSPVKDGKVYFIGEPPGATDTSTANIGLVSLDLETFETKDTGVKYYGNNTGSIWMEIPGNKDLPGESLVFFSRTDNALVALNTESKKTVKLDYELPAIGVTIQDMENGLGNRILMGSYMGDELVSYNPDNGEQVKYVATQTETIKLHGNYAYAGCYTQGVLYEYNLTQPPSASNPKTLCNLSQFHQERIFDMCIAEDRYVIMGTYPNKGYTNGGIAIYDMQTRKLDFYDDVVPGQSIDALAYKDGVVYGGSCIYINAAPLPCDEAYLFSFDLEKRKVIKKVPLKIPGVTIKNKVTGDMEIGPDGEIWCVSTGAIFSVDPETLEVKKSVIADTMYDTRRTMSKIAAMYWDENGYLYTVCNGWFILLDPDTMKFTNTRVSMQYFIIGGDGNIYYNGWSSNGSQMSKLTISALTKKQAESARAAVSEGLFMQVGNCGASIDGKPVLLDTDDRNVTPIEKDGHVLIPLRFAGEILGGKVAWSEATQIAVVRIGKKALKASVGSREVCIGGKKHMMDVPLEKIGGRTYIQADAFCKAFDKSFYEGPDGFLGITPDGSPFVCEGELLENTVKYLKMDVPSLASGNFNNNLW